MTAGPRPDGDPELAAARSILVELGALLDEERAALRALDMDRVGVLGERKLEAAQRLCALGAVERAARDPAPSEASRELRRIAGRTMAAAQVNLALLVEATETLAEALGGRVEAGTYDARARVSRRALPAPGRSG